MTDRWALADLRASAIFDATRTGAVAERNGRTLAEAAGLSHHETTPGGPALASTAAHAKASTSPAAAARVQTSLSGGAFPSVQARKHAGKPGCEQAGTTPDGWLRRLMACGGFAGRLDPEQELSARAADQLRGLTRTGRLRAVWSCHPAEVRMGGRIGQMLQSLLLFMGVVPGSSDFVFTWGTGAGWIELKVEERQPDLLRLRKDGTARAAGRTYLRNLQPDFREWCLMHGVKHAVCRSVPEVLATLREWGRLL